MKIKLMRSVFILGLLLATSILAMGANLQSTVAANLMRIEEFRFIRAQAQSLHVQVYLLGGTAAAVAHYANWDLKRSEQPNIYAGPPEFFQYKFSQIFKSSQDIDLVVDGDPEAIDKLETLIKVQYPYYKGEANKKSVWELRPLRYNRGSHQALLQNPDFLNQHTDSNSIGIINISEEFAQPVGDLQHWNQPEQSQFVSDVERGVIQYLPSISHESTSAYRAGNNPQIISVIRFLIKANQFDLKITSEDEFQIKQIIEQWNAAFDAEKSGTYLNYWIAENAPKLLKNAIDLEKSFNLIDRLGLRKKLLYFGSKDKMDDVAWLMNKEPLRSFPLSNKIYHKTAQQLGVDLIAHETRLYDVYEGITQSPVGTPNFFISRSGNYTGEVAVSGNGVYAAIGNVSGHTRTGLTVRLKVNPLARENDDFKLMNGSILILNRNAIQISPEFYKYSFVDFIKWVATDETIFKKESGIVLKLTQNYKTELENYNHSTRKHNLQMADPAQTEDIHTFLYNADFKYLTSIFRNVNHDGFRTYLLTIINQRIFNLTYTNSDHSFEQLKSLMQFLREYERQGSSQAMTMAISKLREIYMNNWAPTASLLELTEAKQEGLIESSMGFDQILLKKLAQNKGTNSDSDLEVFSNLWSLVNFDRTENRKEFVNYWKQAHLRLPMEQKNSKHLKFPNLELLKWHLEQQFENIKTKNEFQGLVDSILPLLKVNNLEEKSSEDSIRGYLEEAIIDKLSQKASHIFEGTHSFNFDLYQSLIPLLSRTENHLKLIHLYHLYNSSHNFDIPKYYLNSNESKINVVLDQVLLYLLVHPEFVVDRTQNDIRFSEKIVKLTFDTPRMNRLGIRAGLDLMNDYYRLNLLLALQSMIHDRNRSFESLKSIFEEIMGFSRFNSNINAHVSTIYEDLPQALSQNSMRRTLRLDNWLKSRKTWQELEQMILNDIRQTRSNLNAKLLNAPELTAKFDFLKAFGSSHIKATERGISDPFSAYLGVSCEKLAL